MLVFQYGWLGLRMLPESVEVAVSKWPLGNTDFGFNVGVHLSHSDWAEALNHLGELGWEVSSAAPVPNTDRWWWLLKRGTTASAT